MSTREDQNERHERIWDWHIKHNPTIAQLAEIFNTSTQSIGYILRKMRRIKESKGKRQDGGRNQRLS